MYRETLRGDAVRVARYNPIQLERRGKARERRKGETKLSADRIYSCCLQHAGYIVLSS